MRRLSFVDIRRGFTILELMISMSIMGILTAVILANYPESATRITLANITHGLALALREAQVRGSAIDSANSAIGGYGIYASNTNTSRFYLFGDLANGTVQNGIQLGDGLYTTSPLDETKAMTRFPANFKLSKLCVGTGFPFTSCNSSVSGGVPVISNLSVVFVRPHPEPKIYVNGLIGTLYSAACMEITSPRGAAPGHVRSVHVFASGRITTSPDGCQ